MSNQPKKEDKVRLVREEVDEVVGIMQQNMEKVIDRGDRLDQLQDKTDELQNKAHQFQKGAKKVRRRMWWNNMKLNIIIAVVVIAILVILSLAIYFGTR